VVVDGLLGVLLVGPDHARGAALDPTDRVEPRHLRPLAVVDTAAVVVDQTATVVEGDAIDGDALVADRAQYEAALDLLAFAGVDRANPAGVVGIRRPRTSKRRRVRT
jgi:hypothetical protein